MKNSIVILITGLIVGLAVAACQQRDSFYVNVQRSDVFFQAYDDHKYDFLWVFDNSASMVGRRDFVKQNMQRFADILNSRKAIDYQMAIVTTDYFNDEGALVTGSGGRQVVTSVSPTAIADFQDLISHISDSATSFWEQGLLSAKQGLYLHAAEFSRPGVPLVVIFLTDEEDYSCKDDCFGVQPEDNSNWKPYSTDYFVKYFQGIKAQENTDVFLFPIVGKSLSACEVASLGSRYMDVASQIGGASLSGSICDSDMKASFEQIAQTIADRGVRFKLSNQASGKNLAVFVNRVAVPFAPENYVYEASTNSVLFTGAIPRNGDIVEVGYSQETK